MDSPHSSSLLRGHKHYSHIIKISSFELRPLLHSLHLSLSTYLHEALQLIEFAVQIFKVLFEKFPESIIKHDFNQNTESLLLRHL